jgi:hypothetical protein
MNKKRHRNTEKYPYCYIYKGKKRFLVWQTKEDDQDTFKLDRDNRLISSRSEHGLRSLLGTESKQLKWSEGAEIDFDRFWNALGRLKVGRSSSARTCIILLDGWNFIEDLARTIGLTEEMKRLHSPLLDKVYDKLFYGNNLPAVTPEGKSCSPLWLREEIVSFRKEFHSIWKILTKYRYIDG